MWGGPIFKSVLVDNFLKPVTQILGASEDTIIAHSSTESVSLDDQDLSGKVLVVAIYRGHLDIF